MIESSAPRQLLTDDEGADSGQHFWHNPGPEFAALSDAGDGQEARSFRLADEVDYLGPHFYPEVLKPQDLADDRFQPKVADAVEKLAGYMKVAGATGKPIVINEFGLKVEPPTLAMQDYSGPRDALYRAFVAACQRDGVQGLLSWVALPQFVLRPGDFTIVPSLAPYSPIEVDIQSSHRRLLFYEPVWELFVWGSSGDAPLPTPSAQAIAAAWPDVPPPSR